MTLTHAYEVNPSQTHSTRDYVVTYEHSNPHLRPNPWNPTFATFQAREVILHFLFSPPPWSLRPPAVVFLVCFPSRGTTPSTWIGRGTWEQGNISRFSNRNRGGFVFRTPCHAGSPSRGLTSTISGFVFVCARRVWVCVPDARRLETWFSSPQNMPFDPGAAEMR